METNLTAEQENELCYLYEDKGLGTDVLAARFHIGKIKVRSILDKYNVTRKHRGKQPLPAKNKVGNWRQIKYPPVENRHYIVFDPLTDFSTTDIHNKGGHLTSYIRKQYDVDVPPIYYRRRYYMTTGDYWWEQWLSVKLVDDKEVKKCPYCDWTTVDLDNKCGMFETHLRKKHGMTKLEYLKKFPDDLPYFRLANKQLDLRLFETNPDNYVLCPVCGFKAARISNHHLAKHGLSRSEAIRLYGLDKICCKSFRRQMSEIAVKVNENMEISSSSAAEREIAEFLQSYGLEYRRDRRILKGQELDIYIPSHNVAIEYDGLFWHNSNFKSCDYHLIKTEECARQGVMLVHIFEDEWKYNPEVVKARLLETLGTVNNRGGSSKVEKCDLKETDIITMTREERRQQFIERAQIVHAGENLDYSQVEYVNNRTAVKIIDHKLRPNGEEYGEFWQTPSNHLRGQEHPGHKGENISKNKRLPQEDVIAHFKEVHKGEKLDYSKVKYINMHTKVEIVCHELRPDGTEYGSFWQEPVVHLKGCTHPELSRDRLPQCQPMSNEEFVERCKSLHRDCGYSYDKVNYTGQRCKVSVYCHHKNKKGKEHGWFSIEAGNLMSGKGCPKCGRSISTAEDEIYEFIRHDLGIDGVRKRDRKILDGCELDLYIPSRQVAIEYNGLRWHSSAFGKDENYHLNKTRQCAEKGISLVHIFEDEWLTDKDQVKRNLQQLLSDNVCYSLVSACDKPWVILTASDGFVEFHNTSITTIPTLEDYQTLFNAYLQGNDKDTVRAVADRRWPHQSRIWEGLGFELETTLPPRCFKVVGDKRILLEDNEDKEGNIIYDCGLLVYKFEVK